MAVDQQSNFNHRNTGFTSSITTVDAKQHAILSVGNGAKKLCSEPSPDVFTVVAQALGVGGCFGKSGDRKAVEAALEAAFSSAEHGSTIPRSQTINMLREQMFRTCERHINDGDSNLELSIQAIHG